ncbi:uncharacterized protein (DUF1800 family) [Azospirillum fermentarium]|uniref:DUF1800 domain-containing protein n=1 Tax=Azospirillum fermentarium TaxID=1233114 RepID=UPI002225DAF7|nr:DUF1800 domain-containing protein [Azospirillum fermentarium]MCW2245726.1 uncharacterized protein (DUF1800 family) [Azospirillum fermentarium]
MMTVPSTTVLNRLAFGPRPGEGAEVERLGLERWLARQLAPDPHDDPHAAAALSACRLRITYDAGEGWAKTDEDRPLASLDKPPEALWPLNDGKLPFAGPERQWPRNEVAAATLLRAVHSQWQVREVMADFWHNHFNVYGVERAVGVLLPLYDRDVIRAHALGNFRAFLEAVACSGAMLVYLNNRTSRAGIANENYARELFELHTLGRDAYLNALYNRWRDVPGAAAGKPAGYIDQDVYEAARAFTGWTLADGAGLGGGVSLPATGRFAYVENWHDNYQKRVLGQEFDPFQGPLADGRRVLDLVADHPATARHLAFKLCRRLVADDPPKRLVDAAARTWAENRRAPDQIARVVRAIVLSPEFAAAPPSKVRRPLELVAGFARAAVPDFTVTMGLIRELDGGGQRLFGQPAPTGYPDTADAWTGAAAMRRRWALVMGLAENRWGTGAAALPAGTPPPATAQAAAEAWQRTLFAGPPDPAVTAAVLPGVGLAPGVPLPADPHKAGEVLHRLAAYVAMAPRFNLR